MPKFIVDIWLDGYDSEEDMEAACEEFIEEQLNFTASSVKVTRIEDDKASNSDPEGSKHEKGKDCCPGCTCGNEGVL